MEAYSVARAEYTGVVSVIIRGDMTSDTISRVLDAAERVRRNFGISVRVDVDPLLSIDPMIGWTHRLGEPGGVEERRYAILKDGSHVEVLLDPGLEESEIEDALVKAAVLAMDSSALQQAEWGSATTRRDPGSFAAGEHTVVTAAM